MAIRISPMQTIGSNAYPSISMITQIDNEFNCTASTFWHIIDTCYDRILRDLMRKK